MTGPQFLLLGQLLALVLILALMAITPKYDGDGCCGRILFVVGIGVFVSFCAEWHIVAQGLSK